MNRSESLLFIAQAQQPQLANPLINTSGQDLIYIGVGSMAVLLALIIGLISDRLSAAILFSLGLSAFVIILVIVA